MAAPMYAFQSTGAAGATDDLDVAKVWLGNALPDGRAALYVRMDLFQAAQEEIASLKSRLAEYSNIYNNPAAGWE